jgi:hypothetical protein
MTLAWASGTADVEAEFARLKDDVEVVHAPKMMPWGELCRAVPRSRGDARRHVHPCNRSRLEAVWRPLIQLKE